jgi:hypothetical protein
MGYTNDIPSQLRRIGDGAGAADTYPYDIYSQIKRIADTVGAAPGAYRNDSYSQLVRIADGISAPAAGYTGDIYGQLRRIADMINAPVPGYTGDLYGQILRIADTGIAAIIFSPNVILDSATVGTAVGTASVAGVTGTPSYSLANSAGGKYAINSSTGAVTVAAALTSGTDSITIHVTGTTPAITDKAFSIVVAHVPVNTVAPAISGSAIQGVTLSCSTGTWTASPTPTFTYQWKRGGVAITGATNSTYAVQNADVGSTLTCTVTATNAGGSGAPATSSATATVTKTTLSYTPVTTGTQGSPYTGATPASSGGTAPYSYSITAGTIPAGTSLDASTGIISAASLTTAATYAGIVLTSTDANGVTDSSAPFTITVAAGGGGQSDPSSIIF